MAKKKSLLRDINFWIIQGFFVGIVFGLPFVMDAQLFLSKLGQKTPIQIGVELLFITTAGYIIYWIGTELSKSARRG